MGAIVARQDNFHKTSLMGRLLIRGLYHRQSSDIEIDDTEMTLTILLVSVISNLTSPCPEEERDIKPKG